MSLTVARRYARALYEEAAQQKKLDAVDEDIAMLQESLAGSPELERFFADPRLNAERKTSVVDSLLAKRVNPITLNFVHLLINKNRETILADIVDAFMRMRDDQQGVVEATARVALPLDAKSEKELSEAVASITGKKVRLNTEVDPSLIGGAVIRVGDTVYDGSVRHQLNNLRKRLENSRALTN